MKNKSIAIIFLFLLAAAPALRAGEQEIREFETEVDGVHAPSSEAVESGFYTKMQNEADEIVMLNDYLEQHAFEDGKNKKEDSAAKPFKLSPKLTEAGQKESR